MLSAGSAPAGELADALRDLNPRLYAPAGDDAKKLQGQLGQWLRGQRDQVNRRDILAWEAIRTHADWEHFRDQKIAALKNSLGTFRTSAPPKVHVTKSIAGDGFTIDNLVYESRPGLWVTANLYRPAQRAGGFIPPAQPPARGDKPSGSLSDKPGSPLHPGILIIHSHHNPKTQGELQDMGMTWARAGCYVLIPDQLGHGERRQHPYVDAKSYPGAFKPGRQDYYFRYNLALQLHLAGESLIGWMANDMMRGVDLLLTKPGIDKRRIALLGSVAGGGDPAGVTAALDSRIGVVVPFNFGGPQPETKFPLPKDAAQSFNYLGGGSWESTRGLRLSGRDGFLPWVIVGSVAPRYLIHAHEFAWDKERDPVWARYQKIYGFYNAADNLAFAHGAGAVTGQGAENTHCNNIGAVHRKAIHAALAKWWRLPIPQEYSKRLPSEELQCWTPELGGRLKPPPLHELALEMAQASADDFRKGSGWSPPGGALHRERLTKRWQPLLGMPELKEGALEAGKLIDVGVGVRLRFDALRLEGFDVPLLRLTPRGPERGTVIALAQQGGAGFLKNRAEHLEALVQKGMTVVIPDLPGCGAAAVPGDGRGRTSAATSHSATAQMLGTTIIGVRLACLRRLMQHEARATPGEGPARLALWADSFAAANPAGSEPAAPWDAAKLPVQAEPGAALLALLAAALEGPEVHSVYLRGGLLQQLSLLHGPFLYVPHDAIVPGALSAGDLDVLVNVYLRRPQTRLLIEASVNGRNQPALARRIPAAVADGRLRVEVEPSSAAAFAAWIQEVLK